MGAQLDVESRAKANATPVDAAAEAVKKQNGHAAKVASRAPLCEAAAAADDDAAAAKNGKPAAREAKCVPVPQAAEEILVCKNCGLKHGKGLPVWPEAAGLFCQEEGVEQSYLESLFCLVTMGLTCGWFHVLGAIELALVLHAIIYRSVAAGTAAAVLLSACWWPLDNRYPWPAFCQSYLFRAWRRYFSYKVVVEEPLQPGRRYLFAELPHGIFPFAQILSATVGPTCFPGIGPMAGVAADIVLRIPGVRQLYGWIGTRSAGHGAIEEMYNDGVHVAVVTGGIAEMYLVSEDEERLYLRERKGFVRLAVKQGADIVPLFFFGQSRLFNLVAPPWLQQLSRRLRTSIMVFYGRFFMMIPFRHPIKMVAGKPILIKQQDEPSPAYVDEIHALLIRRTEELYARHRPLWETRPLVIC